MPLDSSFSLESAFSSEGDIEPVKRLDVGRPHPRADSTAAAESVPLLSSAEHEFAAAVETPRPGQSLRTARFEVSGPSDSAEDVLQVSELLDKGVVIEWPEAVAIVRRICDAVAKHPSVGAQQYYLLDPRNIEITKDGKVHVFPGEPGGDLFVKQVGRILRALLEVGNAPLPLRLLASQAVFELPGFATLQELSKALETFEAPNDSEAIRTAFRRGRSSKDSTHAPSTHWQRTTAAAVAGPETSETDQGEITRPDRSRLWRGTGAPLAAALLLATVGGGVFLMAPEPKRAGALPQRSAAREIAPLVDAPDKSPGPASGAPGTNARGAPGTVPEQAASPVVGATSPAAASLPLGLPRQTPARSAENVTELTRVRPPDQRQPVSNVSGGAKPVVIADPEELFASRAPTVSVAEPTERIRRVFDTRLLANPFYELSPQDATPEAIEALRDSKRVLLPSLARRDFLRSQAAFEMSDYEEAISYAERALQIIDDNDLQPIPSELRDGVRQLLRQAREAREREVDRVYTIADEGVVPPAELHRQLPTEPPLGLAVGAVGQLEMVIGRDGVVEVIRLHTPLNRFHERMIVSAAKAWRYEPATRRGLPVRFRLFRTINLPEN
jgi:hypothetical protein